VTSHGLGDEMKNWALSAIPSLLLFLSSCSNGASYDQPILYNHKKHIEEAGLTCFDCHSRVLTHQKASIPNIDYCQNCHKEAMTDSKEEEKLVRFITNKEQIPWVQVHRVPDHAYFSHRRHVIQGKVACDQCHGNVGQMTLPFSKPAVSLKMKFCIQCHEKKRVNTDCATCHR
jgi:hypothetical protein